MEIKIEKSWKEALKDEFNKEYFLKLTDFIRKEYSEHTIYPAGKDIFKAYDLCPFNETKVVILGQDPYHGAGQAHGLCFSVPQKVTFPPSLKNIYKEIEADTGAPSGTTGNLESWAKQGVLLLNATLTVRANIAGSHQHKGWEQFTDASIKKIAENLEHVVFILWGSYAQKKSAIIDPSKHFILKSVHPSPLSAHRGFFGNKHFSRCNNYLVSKGKTPIHW